MSMRISTAQASTKPAPRIFLDLRLRHFPWQLSHKMSLVTCRCAFRLGKLAQNGCRSLGLRHFTSESRVKWFLRSVHFHFDCAGSHKTVVAALVCDILPENFRVKWLLWHVDVHFDGADSHKTVVAVLVSGILPENSRIKLLLRHVHVPFDCARW